MPGIIRRNKSGRFSTRGSQVYSRSTGKKLYGKVREAAITADRNRRKQKPSRPSKPSKPSKPRQQPDSGQLLPHSSPRSYKSSFRFFLESVDNGHFNQVKTCYVICSKTDAKYVTARNKDGTRVYAVKLGDLRLSDARVYTVQDVAHISADKYLAIRALKGSSIAGTPNEGDPVRQEIARKKLWTKEQRRKAAEKMNLTNEKRRKEKKSKAKKSRTKKSKKQAK